MGGFYTQSSFLVHYFYSSNELKTSLINYLHYINNGYSQDQAFTKAFNTIYAELNKSAKRYLDK